ncbi:uncharacterized protein MYCFIDRAFT_176605 [Pseudocercospora fijiensis CIRAD86]|uniref:Uncharacterized protein n=1 Tax=Pseudocercospora fijiensis (strain CIRAD86) TaxID=383855 RepID=M2YUB9_PSEFD|nr:uncharacterized protein MYCFIDRAFT_176605 [Pseudocercospora fijiensis CIRAD86]EME81315.1 hypothetical protein MYCFIDRAFT_176605 [Pseudocercospora fijiensis CIRAD86]
MFYFGFTQAARMRAWEARAVGFSVKIRLADRVHFLASTAVSYHAVPGCDDYSRPRLRRNLRHRHMMLAACSEVVGLLIPWLGKMWWASLGTSLVHKLRRNHQLYSSKSQVLSGTRAWELRTPSPRAPHQHSPDTCSALLIRTSHNTSELGIDLYARMLDILAPPRSSHSQCHLPFRLRYMPHLGASQHTSLKHPIWDDSFSFKRVSLGGDECDGVYRIVRMLFVVCTPHRSDLGQAFSEHYPHPSPAFSQRTPKSKLTVMPACSDTSLHLAFFIYCRTNQPRLLYTNRGFVSSEWIFGLAHGGEYRCTSSQVPNESCHVETSDIILFLSSAAATTHKCRNGLAGGGLNRNEDGDRAGADSSRPAIHLPPSLAAAFDTCIFLTGGFLIRARRLPGTNIVCEDGEAHDTVDTLLHLQLEAISVCGLVAKRKQSGARTAALKKIVAYSCRSKRLVDESSSEVEKELVSSLSLSLSHGSCPTIDYSTVVKTKHLLVSPAFFSFSQEHESSQKLDYIRNVAAACH